MILSFKQIVSSIASLVFILLDGVIHPGLYGHTIVSKEPCFQSRVKLQTLALLQTVR